MVWIYIREEKVREVFDNREKAVAYFKEMLLQTLKDFKNQDKNKEYDYPIVFPAIKIIPIKKREPFLGL